MRLTALEVSSGLVFGADPRPCTGSRLSPLAALEQAVLAALRRPPCVVSFSGGCDSSVVLAVAARVAARESLPLPIPVTNRFPKAQGSDEAMWQERVVRHLGLSDWVRLSFDDELDVLGPVARASLRRHGLLWPFNAHFHVPILEVARGGALLTGVGGDEVLGASGWYQLERALRRRRRPQPRDGLRLLGALAPRSLREARERRRPRPQLPWLRREAMRAVEDAWAREEASEPVVWRRRIAWRAGLRYLDDGVASIQMLATEHDAVVCHPFIDDLFVAAVASLPARRRFLDRAEAMADLFSGVLDGAVLRRATKAHFDQAFWNRHSKEFVRGWAGGGSDSDIVAEEALRAEWRKEQPDARTLLLLQSIWLSSQPQHA